MVELIYLVILGALGGFARHIVSSKGRIVLPHLDKTDSEIFLDLGTLLNVILGALFGLLVPYGLGALIRTFIPTYPITNDFITAFFAGLGSVDLTENFIEKIYGRKGEQESIPLTRTGVPK